MDVKNSRDAALFFRTLFEAAPAGIVTLDLHDHVYDANPAFCDMFGYNKTEVQGKPLNSLIADESMASEASNISAKVAGGDTVRIETKRYRKDKKPIDVRIEGAPIKRGGELVGIFAIYINITELKRVTEALAKEKEIAEVTLHAIGDAVLRTDTVGRVNYMNPIAEALSGWPSEEAAGKHVSEVLKIVNEESRLEAPNPIARCLREGRVVGLANHSVLISRDGVETAVADSAAPVKSATGRVIGAIMVFRDVGTERSLHRRLSYQATHDDLTSLHNRAALETRLAEVIGSRRSKQCHTFIYLDLDQFKLINDARGHPAGDAVLRQVAEKLRTSIRESDFIARMGGDEFAVLLINCDPSKGHSIARQMVEILSESVFIYDAHTFRLGASAGVVQIDDKFSSLSELLKAADQACYQAKELGGHRAYVYDDSDSLMRAGNRLIDQALDLRHGLHERRLVLHHQRILPLTDHMKEPVDSKLNGIEILARLKDVDGNLIAPSAFIPAAERYGLIQELDRGVICAVLESIDKAPHAALPEFISINISGRSVVDPAFHEFLHTALSNATRQRPRLCFEITETIAISHIDRARELMNLIHAFRDWVAIDDFGSGAASFGYLMAFPVDIVKIDGGFVAGIESDPVKAAITESVARVATSRGAQVIAEGVETKAERQVLVDSGISWGQGYLLHRPEQWQLHSLS